jgi:hypothetical protein
LNLALNAMPKNPALSWSLSKIVGLRWARPNLPIALDPNSLQRKHNVKLLCQSASFLADDSGTIRICAHFSAEIQAPSLGGARQAISGLGGPSNTCHRARLRGLSAYKRTDLKFVEHPTGYTRPGLISTDSIKETGHRIKPVS